MRRKAAALLDALGCPSKELSILFTDDGHIAKLNGIYRKKEGPTNVLAFPQGSPDDLFTDMLGDVVISVDTAGREAESLGEPFEITIQRLMIHGLLHLLGYDHERSGEAAEEMEKEERRLLAMIREDN
ncbi:rRNA maturation RNase YbeY [bacterium]|nr:rRNA maturation RNase YbeY [bacterium]